MLTITRDADHEPEPLCAAVGAIPVNYYLELEGEPGELLAEGFLLGYDPATRTARIEPGNEGEPIPGAAVVTVDVQRVTQVVIP